MGKIENMRTDDIVKNALSNCGQNKEENAEFLTNLLNQEGGTIASFVRRCVNKDKIVDRDRLKLAKMISNARVKPGFSEKIPSIEQGEEKDKNYKNWDKYIAKQLLSVLEKDVKEVKDCKELEIGIEYTNIAGPRFYPSGKGIFLGEKDGKLEFSKSNSCNVLVKKSELGFKEDEVVEEKKAVEPKKKKEVKKFKMKVNDRRWITKEKNTVEAEAWDMQKAKKTAEAEREAREMQKALKEAEKANKNNSTATEDDALDEFKKIESADPFINQTEQADISDVNDLLNQMDSESSSYSTKSPVVAPKATPKSTGKTLNEEPVLIRAEFSPYGGSDSGFIFTHNDTEVTGARDKVMQYVKENLAEGKVVDLIFGKKEEYAFEDAKGWHAFDAKGEDMLAIAEGKVISFDFTGNTGAYKFKDNEGWHRIDPNSEEAVEIEIPDSKEAVENADEPLFNSALDLDEPDVDVAITIPDENTEIEEEIEEAGILEAAGDDQQKLYRITINTSLSENLCMMACVKINNQKLLKDIARFSNSKNVSQFASNKIKDQEFLRDVARSSNYESVAESAFHRISDPVYILHIANNSKHESVQKLAQKKIDSLPGSHAGAESNSEEKITESFQSEEIDNDEADSVPEVPTEQEKLETAESSLREEEKAILEEAEGKVKELFKIAINSLLSENLCMVACSRIEDEVSLLGIVNRGGHESVRKLAKESLKDVAAGNVKGKEAFTDGFKLVVDTSNDNKEELYAARDEISEVIMKNRKYNIFQRYFKREDIRSGVLAQISILKNRSFKNKEALIRKIDEEINNY